METVCISSQITVLECLTFGERTVFICGRDDAVSVQHEVHVLERGITRPFVKVLPCGVTVHGVRRAHGELRCIAFGGRSASLFTIEDDMTVSNITTKNFGEWVFDCCSLSSGDPMIAVGFANNYVEIYSADFSTGPYFRYSCSERAVICSLILSPSPIDSDNTLFVIAGTVFGPIVCWQATGESGTKPNSQTLEGHGGSVFGLRLASGGGYLCSCGVDREARIWRREAGGYQLLAVCAESRARVWVSAFNIANDSVAIAGEDGCVRLYSLPDAQLRLSYKAHHGKHVRSVLFTNTGEIVSGGGDGGVAIRRVQTIEASKLLFKGEIEQVSMTQEQVFTWTKETLIRYRTDGSEPGETLFTGQIATACISTTGIVLLVSHDGVARLYSSDGTVVGGWHTHERRHCAAFSLDSRTWALATSAMQLSVWRYSDEEDSWQSVHNADALSGRVIAATVATIPADKTLIVTALSTGALQAWACGVSSSRPSLKVHGKNAVVSIVASTVDELFLSAGRDGLLTLFRCSVTLECTTICLQTFSLPMISAFTGLRLVPEIMPESSGGLLPDFGATLVADGYDGDSYGVWNLSRHRQLAVSQVPRVSLRKQCIVVSDDLNEARMVLHTNEGTFLEQHRWGGRTLIPSEHGMPVTAVILHELPDGRVLAVTASEDTTLIVRTLHSNHGERHMDLRGHSCTVHALAICSSNTSGHVTLFSGGGREAIVAWDQIPGRSGQIVFRRTVVAGGDSDDVESRVMALHAITSEDSILLASLHSNGDLKIMRYVPHTGRGVDMLYQTNVPTCGLVIRMFPVPQRPNWIVVLAGGNDGMVYATLVSVSLADERISRNDFPSTITRVHQIGTNCLDAGWTSPSELLVVTGGDDQSLAQVHLTVEEENGQPLALRVGVVAARQNCHTSAVRGIAMGGPGMAHVVSVGADRRLLEWTRGDGAPTSECFSQTQSHVIAPAEASSLAAIWRADGSVLVGVTGDGWQCVRLTPT